MARVSRQLDKPKTNRQAYACFCMELCDFSWTSNKIWRDHVTKQSANSAASTTVHPGICANWCEALRRTTLISLALELRWYLWSKLHRLKLGLLLTMLTLLSTVLNCSSTVSLFRAHFRRFRFRPPASYTHLPTIFHPSTCIHLHFCTNSLPSV